MYKIPYVRTTWLNVLLTHCSWETLWRWFEQTTSTNSERFSACYTDWKWKCSPRRGGRKAEEQTQVLVAKYADRRGTNISRRWGSVHRNHYSKQMRITCRRKKLVVPCTCTNEDHFPDKRDDILMFIANQSSTLYWSHKWYRQLQLTLFPKRY